MGINNNFKGKCGVEAEVPSEADAIRFKCPKCKKIHSFENMDEKVEDNS